MSRTRLVLALPLALAVVVAVGLRFFDVDPSSADQPVLAQADSGNMREEQNRAHLAVSSAGSGQARDTVASPSLEQGASDGLLRGTLYDLSSGDRKLFSEEAKIRFAPASSVTVELEGEEDESLSFLEYTMEWTVSGERAPIPTALAGVEFPVKDGQWSMPQPTEAMVAVGLSTDGDAWRLVSGRQVAAGSSTAVVHARAPLTGKLHVSVQGMPGVAQGITVLEAPAIPMGQQVRVRQEASVEPSFDAPDRDRSGLRAAPEPPDHAADVALDTASPVTIKMREYHREIWVGKPGYQWERLRWSPRLEEAHVELRPVGRFEIELHNADNTGGAFDLRLVRDRRMVAHWNQVMGDGIFPVKDLGAGEYRLLLRRRTQGGLTDIYDSVVTVIGGETRVLAIDVAALGEAELGGIRAAITPPPTGTLHSDYLTVVVSPKGVGAAASAQGKHHALRNMPFVGSDRILELTYLRAGDYQAHVFPSSIVREFTVVAGEVQDMSIDLSSVAEITVWPVAAEGEPELPESMLAPGRLRWRVMEDREDPSGQDSGTLAGAGVVQLPATWIDGAWRLLSVPGTLSAVVEPYGDGTSMGQISMEPVAEGPNDLIVPLKPGSGYHMDVLVQGAPQDSDTRRQLATELLTAVRATQGTGEASFVNVVSTGAEGSTGKGLLAQIELTAAGEYFLDCSAAWSTKIVQGGTFDKVPVEAGRPASLRVNWQD